MSQLELRCTNLDAELAELRIQSQKAEIAAREEAVRSTEEECSSRFETKLAQMKQTAAEEVRKNLQLSTELQRQVDELQSKLVFANNEGIT